MRKKTGTWDESLTAAWKGKGAQRCTYNMYGKLLAGRKYCCKNGEACPFLTPRISFSLKMHYCKTIK